MAEKLIPKKDGSRYNVLFLLVSIWGFSWWFGGWFGEILRISPINLRGNNFLILVSLSAFLSWAGGVLFKLKFFLTGMIPAPVIAFFTVFLVYAGSFGYYRNTIPFSYNFFDSTRIWGWISFILLQGLSLFFFRPGKTKTIEAPWFRDSRIFIFSLVSLGVLSATGRFLTNQYGLSESWTSLAGLLPAFAYLIVLSLFKGQRKLGIALYPVLPFILSAILGFWFLFSLFQGGNPSPLPFYIPLINPLDLLGGLCIISIFFWQIKKREGVKVLGRTGIIVLGDIMVFLWIASILARSVHYYAGLPWHRIFSSDQFQLCLFIFWGLYGILHIIIGNRKKLRKTWMAGAILVGADIAKLILFDLRGIETIPRVLSFFAAGLILLFIGWAAPLPPPPPSEDK